VPRAFSTDCRSIASCVSAPATGGSYPIYAGTMPSELSVIPPTALRRDHSHGPSEMDQFINFRKTGSESRSRPPQS
jgi:hypothetical protein